jgi:adenylate kinase family enzyme
MSNEEFAGKKIISLLGGPGSGKGTASERIRKDYNVRYMCAGDLLRAAAKEDTKDGKDLAEMLKNGVIVPQEITIGLLRKEILKGEADFYIIDGFPRAVEQAQTFEKQVKPFDAVIFLEADDDILIERLMKRAKESGRSDDNPESIKKRITVFHNQSYPVVEYFEPMGKVTRVDAKGTPDEVYAAITPVLNKFAAAK